ncbi:hypothetical protein PCANC_13929 [Puccinia coronata f. sp. avenae]|uniref:Uncharacterized protein n=1 Tax=Puccinia coronata f. sp. avenae TaxID=200324 RepID=A0A2N5SUN1_9BASI|nr:hypothetical protein PCANC_26328 [Puccinia coronata f. sp. avenae]PLW16958.1 hypothetical protein PCANC_13929 [Puccinia coronata f. sp. avenae]
MVSEQEADQISGLAQSKELAASDGAVPHFGTGVMNPTTEPLAMKLDAKGLDRSLGSDEPESSHPYEVAITIDTQTAAQTFGMGQTSPSTINNLREPEPSHAVRSPTLKRAFNRLVKSNILVVLVKHQEQATIIQVQAEEGNHAANPNSDTKASNSFSAPASISDSKGARPHDEKSQASKQLDK